VLLLAVGVGMLWSAFRKVEAPETVPQVHFVALWVAYGKGRAQGRPLTSAGAESDVDYVVGQRMKRNGHMQWTRVAANGGAMLGAQRPGHPKIQALVSAGSTASEARRRFAIA
jgi:hypothetical protein